MLLLPEDPPGRADSSPAWPHRTPGLPRSGNRNQIVHKTAKKYDGKRAKER